MRAFLGHVLVGLVHGVLIGLGLCLILAWLSTVATR